MGIEGGKSLANLMHKMRDTVLTKKTNKQTNISLKEFAVWEYQTLVTKPCRDYTEGYVCECVTKLRYSIQKLKFQHIEYL